MDERGRGRILTVCTGNICRSPAAQLLLADRLGNEVAVASAGTRAMVDHPVEPAMARLLDADGISTEGLVARRLTPSLAADADLILGLSREHRTAVVQQAPRALKRTFTLRELARLAERLEPGELEDVAGPDPSLGGRIRALTQIAPRRRTQVAGELDDVIDPYRRDEDVHAHVYAQIRDCVDTLTRVLAPRSD